MMKLCKDCKHAKPDYGILYCHSPKNGIEPVNGGIAKKFSITQREIGPIRAIIYGWCGKRGRWFEPKEEE